MIWQQLRRRNINGQSSSMRERERHPLFDSFRDGTQCSTPKLPWIFFVTTDNIFCHLPKHDPRALLRELLSVQKPLGYSKRHRNFNYYGYSLLIFFVCLFPCRSHLKSVPRPVTVAAVTNRRTHQRGHLHRPPLRPPAVFELQIR